MQKRPLVEICVQSAQGVRAARLGGADRVEICIDIASGGLTPPEELILESVAEAPREGIQILVRSRRGNFTYTKEEALHMAATIRRCDHVLTAANPRVPWGFVVGATRERRIDRDAATLWRAATSARLTFHRAFDTLTDLDRGVDELIELGYQRVLTTGGDATVAQPERLAHLQQRAGDQLIILASGGLRSHNVRELAGDAREVHMRAPAAQGTDTSQQEVEAILAALS